MPKSILLTGSTGFVGVNLAKSLTLKSDYRSFSEAREYITRHIAGYYSQLRSHQYNGNTQ